MCPCIFHDARGVISSSWNFTSFFNLPFSLSFFAFKVGKIHKEPHRLQYTSSLKSLIFNAKFSSSFSFLSSGFRSFSFHVVWRPIIYIIWDLLYGTSRLPGLHLFKLLCIGWSFRQQGATRRIARCVIIFFSVYSSFAFDYLQRRSSLNLIFFQISRFDFFPRLQVAPCRIIRFGLWMLYRKFVSSVT